MLGFFRKYQKFFFLFVTVIIVISFTFFGAVNSAFTTQKVAPDKMIGKGVDGSPLFQRETLLLAHLLNSGHEQKGYVYTGKMPLLVNDGVIFKDFLSNKTASVLSEKYFAWIKPDLEERIAKIKRFQPYQHPIHPNVSSVAVWGQVVPSINEDLHFFKNFQGEVTPQVFSRLCNLYVSQAQFPAEILKRFLMFQQSQYGQGGLDPHLERADLSLFGFHTIEEWFGKNFLHLFSQFIQNAALTAENKGYRASIEEAKKELYQNTYVGLQGIVNGEEFKNVNVAQFVRNQCHSLGVDELAVAKAWRKVILCRRLFNEVGDAVFVDPLAQEQFLTYTNEAAVVDLYQLPESLRLKDFSALLKLQIYLDAVAAAKPKNPLLLPEKYLTADEVERKTPELVQRTFVVEYAEAKKEDFALKISLKDLWDWELKEENFERLKKAFPSLIVHNPKSREERFALLEKCAPTDRLAIDAFARDKMVDSHPEWIDVALATTPLTTQKISLRGRGSKFPFKGVEDTKELLSLLLSQPKIERFSADNKHFYKIHVKEKPQSKQILTFSDALADRTLDELLERRLQDVYDGSKPLAEVKDQVGEKLYPEILKAIQEDYNKSSKKEAPSTRDFYVNYRLYAFVREAQKNLQKNPQDLHWLADRNEQTTLQNQWRLLKGEREITRSSKDGNGKEDLFSIKEGNWSSIHSSKYGDLCFSHLISKSMKKELPQEKIASVKEHLKTDAKRVLMHKLVREIAEKKAISLKKEEDSHLEL